MNNAAFFERIGLPADTKIEHSYAFLKLIQYHAVTSIPYENLDLCRGKLLSLEWEDVFEKVVTRHRGGYCFEVNALLSHFYKENGFMVKDYLARYLRGEKGVPMRRHRIMVVSLPEGDFLCDIGVGQKAPRYPLKVEESVIQEQFGEEYKLEKDDDLGWVVYDRHKGEWRTFISFTTETQYEIDFYQPSFYFETHPTSAFNKTYIIAMKTGDGRKTINDRSLKIFSGDAVVYVEDDMSDERRDQVLEEEFYLKNFKE